MRSLKRLLCCPLFCAALLLVPIAQAQKPDDQLYTASRQQLDVTKALLAQQTAWNKGDVDAFLAFFKDAPDTEVILAGPTRGLAAIRNAYHLNFPKPEAMGTLENSEVNVRPLGENFALVTGKYHIARPKRNGGDIEGTFSDVFEKTDSGWKVIFAESL